MTQGIREEQARSRQGRVLAFIVTYLEKNKFPPTFREISQGAGVPSGATVAKDLQALEERGSIERLPGANRAIRVIEP